VGAPVNLFLLRLIYTRTSKEMRPYARILTQTAVIDLAHVLSFFLYTPVFISNEEMSLVYGVGLATVDGTTNWANRHWNYGLCLYWLFVASLATFIIPVQFYYRYAVMGGKEQLGSSGSPRTAVYLFLYLFPIGMACTQCALVLIRRETIIGDEAFALASRVLTPIQLRTMAGYTKSVCRDPAATAIILLSLVGEVCTYTLIVYFSVRIWLRLRSAVALLASDSQLREANRQLNRVLATQALLPLVTAIGAPIFISVVDVLGVADVGFETQASMSLLLTLQPVTNGLATLLLIKPYRLVITSVFFGRCKSVPVMVRVKPMSTVMSRAMVDEVIW